MREKNFTWKTVETPTGWGGTKFYLNSKCSHLKSMSYSSEEDPILYVPKINSRFCTKPFVLKTNEPFI